MLVKCQGNQVQCFDSCGPSAVTLSLSSSAAICCASGGSAFIDLLDESAGCQLCSDLEGNNYTLKNFVSLFKIFFLKNRFGCPIDSVFYRN